MIVIDQRTGLPMKPVLPPQQPGLTAGQVVGGILLGVGLAAFASDVATVLGELLNHPQKRGRRADVRFEDDELSDLEWIFDRTNGRCFYCGKVLCINNRGYYGGRGAWEADHFIAFSRRGADHAYNLVAACVGCNRAKSDLQPWQFDERFRLGDRNPCNYI